MVEDATPQEPDSAVAPEGAVEAESNSPAPHKGSIRSQDSSTQPRPPTLAEERARQRAEREQQETEEAERAAAERKSKIRKRVLIGGGVGVGLAAIVASWYALSQPSNVVARCTDQNNVVVDDQYCDTGSSYYLAHQGFLSPGGIFIFPGGTQYHYYYGGNGTVGQQATGGTITKPDNANITTNTGRTIQRGGFGVKGGSSGGGDSGSVGKSGGS